MFDTLSQRLGDVLRSLSGRGRLTEDNVRSAMADVRRSLLDADVALSVVETFCDEVQAEALGTKVLGSLKPAEAMIGIVHRHLVDLMGEGDPELMLVEPGPTIVMLCGLQGTGKTTTCAKLAGHLRRQGRRVMVAAADLQRPAAVEQLRTIVEQVAADPRGGPPVGFHGEPERCAEYGTATGVAVDVCRRALDAARAANADVLLLDTAGRLHVDNVLMAELQAINHALAPQQILLVVDAMAGQDAIHAARTFHERLQVDGIILAKFDSDARGGAVLSVRRVTGAPVRFLGTGEGLDALEPFHAERMAGRILGMGDVVSLVEKAHEEVSEEEALSLAQKMAEGRLTMDDFLKQLRTMRRMGPLKQLMGMLPGVGSSVKDLDVDEKTFDRIEAIASSMTTGERADVEGLSKSRIRRIADGSGTSTTDVNRLRKQFQMMQAVSKRMASSGMKGSLKAAKEMAGADPAALEAMMGTGGGSTKTTSHRARFKRRKRK